MEGGDNLSKCKKIVLSCCLVALLFCSVLPLSASAAVLNPMVFNFSNPYVSNTTGYVAIKGERTDLNNAEQAFILYYQISPIYNATSGYESDNPLFVVEDIYSNAFYFNVRGDAFQSYHISVIVMHQDGTVQSVLSDDFENDFVDGVFYFNSSFRITNIDVHGNIDRSALESDYPAFDYIFTEDKYEYMYLLSIFNVLVEYGELEDDELELLQSLVTSNQSVESILKEIKSTFSDKLDTIINDNVEFKAKLADAINYLSSIDSTTSSIRAFLRTFCEECLDLLWLLDDDLLNIWGSVDDLEDYTDEIEVLLQELIDYLQPDTDVNVSKVDTSNLDSYFEAENSLLNNDNVDVSNAVKVEIDQQAMVVIWDKLQAILDLNPKVFGLIITVLSISVVALILGRGN